MLNLTLNVSTQSTNAVWICQLCDTVYVHLWSSSLWGKSLISLWHHRRVFKIYTVMYTHLTTVHVQWMKCACGHLYECVGESSARVHLFVLTFTWQFSRWAECADASTSGSTVVRGDDAIGYFRAGRGRAFSAEGGAKTVHCHQCLGTTLWVRKHKTHMHIQYTYKWMIKREYYREKIFIFYSCL